MMQGREMRQDPATQRLIWKTTKRYSKKPDEKRPTKNARRNSDTPKNEKVKHCTI